MCVCVSVGLSLSVCMLMYSCVCVCVRARVYARARCCSCVPCCPPGTASSPLRRLVPQPDTLTTCRRLSQRTTTRGSPLRISPAVRTWWLGSLLQSKKARLHQTHLRHKPRQQHRKEQQVTQPPTAKAQGLPQTLQSAPKSTRPNRNRTGSQSQNQRQRQKCQSLSQTLSLLHRLRGRPTSLAFARVRGAFGEEVYPTRLGRLTLDGR